MNILINAYAISPYKGSEPGMGWNWVKSIGQNHTLHILTEAEFKNDIEAELQNIPKSKNFNFYFIDIGVKAREMCWNQGDWRFYYYYRNWQKKCYDIALTICNNENIDLIHQLNMVGYREPGILWKIPDIPIIWGPVGGFGKIPGNYLQIFPLKQAIKQYIKGIINNYQYKLPYIRSAISNANIVIACNSEAQKKLSIYRNKRPPVISEVGTTSIQKTPKEKRGEKTLKLLWIGRNIPSKALVIALKVMESVKNYDIHLDIIGVEKDSVSCNNYQNITFHNWIPHNEIPKYYTKGHLLFFTSLFEATGTVVLEALSMGVPVLCHDTCGQGDIINDSCGKKIPLINVNKSIEGFRESILKIYEDQNLIPILSKGAINRAKDLTWEKNISKLNDLYFSLKKTDNH